MCLTVAAVAFAVSCTPIYGARVLTFGVSTGEIAGISAAEVNADGMVVMRLRSTSGAGLEEKATIIASRLTDLALGGLKPGDVAVERVQGQWAVTGSGRLIVTADAATAEASGLPSRSLCESWARRLRELLGEPYLCFKPHDILLIPYAEKRAIHFGGTVPERPVISCATPDVVSIDLQADAGRAVLRGLQTGTTVVTFESGHLRHAITVEVKKWAARIGNEAILRIMDAGIRGTMADTALKNAALSAVDPEPGVAVRVTDREQINAGYRISVRGGGVAYLPVTGEVLVRVVGGLRSLPEAHHLFVSNAPERVTGVGALMRQALPTGQSARLMWHHKNYVGRPVVLGVRLLNAGKQAARVDLSWAQAGPDGDEIFVGFNAMWRYWTIVRGASGFQAHIPAQSVLETSAITMKSGDVVSGLLELMARQGDDVYVEVLARDPEDAPDGFASLPHPDDPLPVTPYQFPASIEAELDYAVGGRFGHLSIGRHDVTNGLGIELAGAYGVNHRIRVNVTNPTDASAQLEIAVRAGGGVARLVAMIEGQLVSTHLLRAGQEQVLARRRIASGVSASVPVELIPTAGSNLPLTLVARAR